MWQHLITTSARAGDTIASTVAELIPMQHRPPWAVRRTVAKITSRLVTLPQLVDGRAAGGLLSGVALNCVEDAIAATLEHRTAGVIINAGSPIMVAADLTAATYGAIHDLQLNRRIAGATIINCEDLLANPPKGHIPAHILALIYHPLKGLYEIPDTPSRTISRFFEPQKESLRNVIVLDRFEKLAEEYSKEALLWLVRDLACDAHSSDAYTVMVNVSDSDLATFLLKASSHKISGL
jgi:hypothetical protein